MKTNYIKRDFTLAKYIELCKTMLSSDHSLLTVEQYLKMEKKPEKFIIIRHDVDDGVDLPYTLEMARKEAELDISATYYFRTHDDVFQSDIIKEVAELRHEIGYHYDVLGEAEGDYAKAIKLFVAELRKLKEIYDVKTISMHGGPMKVGLTAATFSDMLKIVGNMLLIKKTFVSWDSKDLWKEYDFRKFDIIGDVYLSINFNNVTYISDTNRSWSDTKHRLKDFVEGNNKAIIKDTDDLIGTIEKNDLQKILILVHPYNWRDEFGGWLKCLILQKIKNAGKSCLMAYWNSQKKRIVFV